VSLAEGSALVALGTDTAGSVRIPAAATGHVGLKVTRGRWSTEGLVPLSSTFDTPGLLVRSVADAVTCFGAVDPVWGDAWALERHIAACALADVRIGVGEAVFWSDCEAGIAEAVEQALGELTRAGARLKQTALPEAAKANAVFHEGGVSAVELRAFLESELPGWLDVLDPINAAVMAKAVSVPATTYIHRRQRLARLAESANAAFEAVDVLACPTLAITPPALATIRDGESHWQANRALTRNTCPVNYLGLCAITLPVGRDRLGLPVGLQLIARGGGEEKLLAIAAAAERALGTASQRLGPCPLLAG
jgi:aspartyl-tRNA(Asn)/glutamyl-tRNA(Gln) amidotransferase subunit A